MSRLREIGEAIGGTVVESVGRAVGRTQEERPLPADLLESEEAFLAVFDAPGVERADVQVRFEDGEVRVRVDRFREFHEGFEMRFPGRGLSMDGSVALPAGAAVDPADASATLKGNGTLQVRVPKTEPIEVFDEEETSGAVETESHEDTESGSEDETEGADESGE